MRKQVRLADAAGKAVECVHETRAEVWVLFADGTFSYQRATDDGYYDGPTIEELDFELCNVRADDVGVFVGMGLITADEAAERKAYFAERDQRFEREQYERLRAKFEPKVGTVP